MLGLQVLLDRTLLFIAGLRKIHASKDIALHCSKCDHRQGESQQTVSKLLTFLLRGKIHIGQIWSVGCQIAELMRQEGRYDGEKQCLEQLYGLTKDFMTPALPARVT